MSLLLYINGQLADLDAGQTIAQTKQVNDLNSLDNRQASYTNKFKLPKTATNVKIMDYLTVTGNNFNIPYQKNECSLFSETGECFVYKGWAVITDGGTDYDAVIYDGIIDLYKAIENKTFADITLTDIIHDKSLSAVKSSWDNNYNYRYILADFNGDTGLTNIGVPLINIDYLVPSVKISYLWQSIFTACNATYSGSVFATENFLNLWLTYPKGLTTTEFNTQMYQGKHSLFVQSGGNSYFIKATELTADGITTSDNIHLKVPQAGTYRVRITGTAVDIGNTNKLFIGKNAHGITAGQVSIFKLIEGTNGYNTIDFDENLYFNEDDTLCIIYKNAIFPYADLDVVIDYVTPTTLNFSSSLSDLSLRDFLTEVVQRFGLTMFKDKYSNHYTFLTLQEQLQTAHLVNWSTKFSKKISENYIYGNYGQRNWFRYNYNDKEATHSDYYFDVSNVNLQENKDVIKSKIYSPEKEKVIFINAPSNVYKLWDKEISKEVNENDEEVEVITYKSLDKRYYLMRCSNPVIGAMGIHSKEAGGFMISPVHYRESFSKLSFIDIVQDFYNPITQLLNKSQIVTSELWLTDSDIANFDFKKLYYIEQLSSYFIINKINNYVPGKPTKCDLVRVQYTGNGLPYLALTHIQINGLATNSYYVNSFGATPVVLQYYEHNDNEIVWQNASGGTQSPIQLTFPDMTDAPTGTFTVRLWCNGLTSNTITITLPANQTIYA